MAGEMLLVPWRMPLLPRPLLVVMLQYGDLRTLKPSDNRLFPDSNGSIIAASYEARAFGVKRLVHLTLHSA